MSKRTAIACASIGIMVLSAAKVTTFVPEDASALASFTTTTSTAKTQTADIDTSSAHYRLLRAIYGPSQPFATDPSATLPEIDSSTLWLARVIYSETKLPHEQELVAWVVRNRVETSYRGESTYRDVVLDPYQFSAFNPGAPRRMFYRRLTPDMQLPGWQQALRIAHYVRHADPAYRPFSLKTRHFFSEVSMPDHRFPHWVEPHRYVSPGWNYTVDARRFRFYEKIS